MKESSQKQLNNVFTQPLTLSGLAYNIMKYQASVFRFTHCGGHFGKTLFWKQTPSQFGQRDGMEGKTYIPNFNHLNVDCF